MDDVDQMGIAEAELAEERERALLNLCVVCGAKEGVDCLGGRPCPSRGA